MNVKVKSVLVTWGDLRMGHLWIYACDHSTVDQTIDGTEPNHEIHYENELSDELLKNSSCCVSWSRVQALLRWVLDTGYQCALTRDGDRCGYRP